MKNIVILLCDSLNYDENFFYNMTFLDELKINSLVFENYFSKGPYTEAALNPILSGTNTLDYKGYMNGLKYKPQTINEIFKELGYKTFNTLWFYPNTTSFLRGVDEYLYVDIYSISYYISAYRLDYFKELKIKKLLSKEHIKELQILIEDFFEMANIYVKDFYQKNYRFDLLNRYTEFKKFDFNAYKSLLEKEQQNFELNKNQYILTLLECENELFNKNNFDILKSETFNEISNEINSFFKKQTALQLLSSIKRCNKNKCYKTFKSTLKNMKEKNSTEYNSIFNWIKYTINSPVDYRYNSLSANVMLDETVNYLKSNSEEKNFVLCHLMDNHYPFNFISSETNQAKTDFYEAKNQFENIKGIKNKFAEMSKKYVDKNIKKFIEELRKNRLLEDTMVVITADHGSSYLNEIYREKIVSNFYDENYKIPLIVYNPSINYKSIDNYGSTLDFIPTILNIIGKEKKLEGKSLLENDNEFIFYEYLGAGCPDEILKNQLICIRSKKYKIYYNVDKNNKFSKNNIFGIYDIQKDKLEVNNLKEYIWNHELEYLLNNIFEKIKKIKK